MTRPEPPDPRLINLLGGDALAALRRRLRRHFEHTDPAEAPGRLRLSSLAAHEHAVLASFLGRPPRASNSLQIDIAAIDARLRDAGIAPSLRHALTQLDGPIAHRASTVAATQARWATVVSGCAHAGLSRHLGTAAGLGLLKRLARQDADAASRLCERAEAVLQHLPAAGLPRAQLAAQTLGDAHALDGGQPTATLVLAVCRQRGAASPVAADTGDTGIDSTADPATDDDAEETTREVWARVGVLVNELARPALFLNLPVLADDLSPSPPGEPGYASLRRLLRQPPRWHVAGRDVFVCENPNLVAIAAQHLGARCAPLVCTDGMPAAAQRTLLAQLAAAGARLRYHGDFDWPGIAIANRVLQTFGARPWRFRAADYHAVVQVKTAQAHRLSQSPVLASWDEALTVLMRQHGVAIAEEAVADGLLVDLGSSEPLP
jgi:uncharacterized protein (TIGR02679 family)